MAFSPQLAEKRFGYGLSPTIRPVSSVGEMLARLVAPDRMAREFPIENFDMFRERMIRMRNWRRELRQARKRGDEGEARRLTKARRVENRHAREAKVQWMFQTFLRRSQTEQAFRERLVAFWGDHFTAEGKQGVLRRATSPYWESAIRPNVTGNFADLLIAATTHPLMLHYLDQERSVGPQSQTAIRRGKKNLGLNENLAREVIELHTLGVNGPYSQTDVTQLAELLTGLTYQSQVGFKFQKNMSEPGAETVLGKTYGPNPGLGPIHDVLRDLAMHPATARHLATKLAIHFVADVPDPGLIAAMEQRYLETSGNLMAVYAAMLKHPAAWDPTLYNIRPPVEYISTCCRALGATPKTFMRLKERSAQQMFYVPLRMMGQNYQRPTGPDGIPEEDAEWITPQGVAARLEWATQVPRRLFPKLPDPREFVEHALGDDVPPQVAFAANAAENRSVAIGLILASPAFQRR